MVTEILAARSIREEKDLVALMTETLEPDQLISPREIKYPA